MLVSLCYNLTREDKPVRSLSSTLLDTQAIAPLAWPAVKVEIKNNRGAVRHLQFSKVYDGVEQQYQHDAVCAGDGSLNRVRQLSNPGDDPNQVYRSRVAGPDAESDYTSWTLIGDCIYGGVTICASGTEVVIFYTATNAVDIMWLHSHDYGASWSAPEVLVTLDHLAYHLTADMKPNGDILLVYFKWSDMYCMKRTGGVWGAPVIDSFQPRICSALSVCYHEDWNIVITGKDDDLAGTIWLQVYGDGGQVTLNTWSAEQIFITMPYDSQFWPYRCYIDYLDEFRWSYDEMYSLITNVEHVYWTHGLPDKHFLDELWREPVPLEIDVSAGHDGYNQGACISHNDDYCFLTTANQVWMAPRALVTADVTDDVVTVNSKLAPGLYRSTTKITLDNTANTYAAFAKLGYEMVLSLGYLTDAGYEYQEQPSNWITGWKFVSPGWFPLRAIYPPGVIGTITIESQDIWDIMAQWVCRHDFEWTVGQKSVRELMQFVLARCGFELDELSHSEAVDSYHPAFAINAGQSGKLAMKKLLSYVEDVLVQRGAKIYLKMPAAADSSDYTYHSTFFTAHLVYRGQYGQSAWIPNRAQVWGTNLMMEDFEWSEIGPLTDRLSRVTKPAYATEAEAARRVERELRHGEMWHGSGGWAQVPVNCGQEVFDVITITDTTAGVTALKRRVLGIQTTYNKLKNTYLQKLALGMP